jgi:hypothetical protein
MKEAGLERIDLLKVDCEGAELEVLLGVEEADWPRIGSIVAEVHDLDGRLAAVRNLIEGPGGGGRQSPRQSPQGERHQSRKAENAKSRGTRAFRGLTPTEPARCLTAQFSACADIGENLRDLLRALILPIFWAVFSKGEIPRDSTGLWCEDFRETPAILHSKSAHGGL